MRIFGALKCFLVFPFILASFEMQIRFVRAATLDSRVWIQHFFNHFLDKKERVKKKEREREREGGGKREKPLFHSVGFQFFQVSFPNATLNVN